MLLLNDRLNRNATIKRPKSRALSEGTAPEAVVDAPIPALVLRREHQAWEDPFVVVYNPYLSDQENAIDEVGFNDNGYGVQEVTLKMKDGSTDVIVAGTLENSLMEQDQVLQNGLVSVTRTTDNASVDFIFVSGMNIYRGHGWEIVSEGAPASVTIERNGDGYQVQSDQPILLRVAGSANFNPGKMTAYKNGEISLVRNGKSSRFDSNQMEFRIAQAYDKIVIDQVEAIPK